MSAPKILTRFGLLAKVEASYATDAAPVAATDGIISSTRVDIAPKYTSDGARSHFQLKRASKGGRYGEADLTHEAAGAGAAYAAGVTPSSHVLMRGAGFDATLTSTPGSEKWAYTPGTPGAYNSLTVESYARGQKSRLIGVYANMKLDFENGGFPKLTFPIMGIMPALPVDSAVPAITYAAAQNRQPARATALQATFAGWSPLRVKSGTYEFDRGLGARANDNQTASHGGFNPGAETKHTLTLVVESTLLSTFNAYQVSELATAGALSINFGATQYDRWKITAPNAQLIDTPEQDENNAAMWELQFELKPSSFGLYDEVAFTFD